MKFTEEKLEKAFTELLGQEGFAQHLDISITRKPEAMKYHLLAISIRMCHHAELKKSPQRFLNWKKKPKGS